MNVEIKRLCTFWKFYGNAESFQAPDKKKTLKNLQKKVLKRKLEDEKKIGEC